LDNPQTLNLYAYLMNNPLAGVDADGHVGPDRGNTNCASNNSSAGSGCQGQPSADQTKAENQAGSAQQPTQTATEEKATPGERAGFAFDAVANTVVGVPKGIEGASALVVGVFGSETGVGVAVAVGGGYELVQASGQMTSALLEGGAAITGNKAGVENKVDKIAATTSVTGAIGTALNHGDYHAGAKFAAIEGIATGSARRELFKTVRNFIDFISNTKELVTK